MGSNRPIPFDCKPIIVFNKMLSYRKDTAMQGALVLAKSEDWNWNW